jgi:hypothetical protein
MKTKEKAQHSSGPWHVGGEHTDFGGTTEDGGYFGIGNGRVAIARALKTGCIDAEEAKANAALIATAPELLEKLKEVVRSADMTERGKVFVPEFIDSCRAAIAKAERP